MFRCLFFSLFLVIFSSCNTTKKAASYSDDKSFFSGLKKLAKNPNDATLKEELVRIFAQVVQLHESKAALYEEGGLDPNEFESILQEFNALQKISDAVRESPLASGIVVKDYRASIGVVRGKAVGYFYNLGKDELAKETRLGAAEAGRYFAEGLRYDPTYRDIQNLRKIAQDKSIANVEVKSVKVGSANQNDKVANVLNASIFRVVDESLVRDLGSRTAKDMKARFYTERELRGSNLNPHFVIESIWSSETVPVSQSGKYNREVSRDIEIGKDTAGKAIMKNVKATLKIVSFNVAAVDIDIRLVDNDRKTVTDWTRINIIKARTLETGTYEGDSRAFTEKEWQILNRNIDQPISDAEFKAAYDKLLADVKGKVKSRL